MYKQDNIMKETHTTEEYLHHCLFFTANRLARVITAMAEEEFLKTGLSPTYAFLIMLVNDDQGISQKSLCEKLHLAPSTVTRFIDKLVQKDLLIRRQEGKNSFIYSTPRGKRLQKEIEKAWTSLYERYSALLGQEEGDTLTAIVDEAADRLG